MLWKIGSVSPMQHRYNPDIADTLEMILSVKPSDKCMIHQPIGGCAHHVTSINSG